jgi:hypothetical protein
MRPAEQCLFDCLSPCAIAILCGDHDEWLAPGEGLSQREFAVVAIR